jgi:hypothetical protein
MRGHAKSGTQVGDAHAFHAAATVHPIDKFSARRPAPGFHDSHVAGEHRVLASADFDAKGAFTGKPHRFWAPDKTGESPLPGHIISGHDYIRHLHGAPVGDGRDRKNWGGKQVGLDYVTTAARDFIGKHIRIFGDSSRKRPAAAPEAPQP